MAYGVDEAWSKLTPAQLLAAGKQFVIGYISEDPSKNLTPAHVAAYRASGIAVLLVYEYSATAAGSGAGGGTANAQLSVKLAKAAGYPKGCAIAFAIDEGSPNFNSLAAYAAAFTNVCHAAGYRTMVYGGYDTVKFCLDRTLVDLAWQTYAWSNNRWDSRAVIRQVQNDIQIAGVGVDANITTANDYGAWSTTTSSLTPPDTGEIVKLHLFQVIDHSWVYLSDGMTRRYIATDALPQLGNWVTGHGFPYTIDDLKPTPVTVANLDTLAGPCVAGPDPAVTGTLDDIRTWFKPTK